MKKLILVVLGFIAVSSTFAYAGTKARSCDFNPAPDYGSNYFRCEVDGWGDTTLMADYHYITASNIGGNAGDLKNLTCSFYHAQLKDKFPSTSDYEVTMQGNVNFNLKALRQKPLYVANQVLAVSVSSEQSSRMGIICHTNP
ncbi:MULTISPECIES: hypothetical protein [Cysteiniphilum]|uniref:hypothetical protein n=1 Tax=Cysteiniphilum TaxID=2056696 RepID=UPI001784F2C7|nr:MULTISPECIES: hypothetical protein [Cysteiniphilum]